MEHAGLSRRWRRSCGPSVGTRQGAAGCHSRPASRRRRRVTDSSWCVEGGMSVCSRVIRSSRGRQPHHFGRLSFSFSPRPSSRGILLRSWSGNCRATGTFLTTSCRSYARTCWNIWPLRRLEFICITYAMLNRTISTKMEPAAEDGVYSIGAVVKMLGVPAQTLRSWEERYHQIVPVRSPVANASTAVIRSISSIHPRRARSWDAARGCAPITRGTDRFPTEPGPTPMASRSRSCLPNAIPSLQSSPSISCGPRGTRRELRSTPRMCGDSSPKPPPAWWWLICSFQGGRERAVPVWRTSRCRFLSSPYRRSTLTTRRSRSGADAFLLKPLDPLQFVSTVRDLLGTSAYLRRPVRAQ